jgi:haloacetate dehalogenase
VLWAGNMPKRPGWQTGSALNMLSVWKARAEDVRGRALDCGHFIPEEAPEKLITELLDFLPAA